MAWEIASLNATIIETSDMKINEFSEALDAYLADRANAFQKFLIEDYFYTCQHNYDIEEIYNDAKERGISDRIFLLIAKMWDKYKKSS